MANPLARVVMNSVAQKSGKVSKNPSRTGNTNGRPNLGRKETQLLSSLLNSKGRATTNNSSYNKNTYGRASNVGNTASNTMKTLESLTAGSSNRTQVNDKKKECIVDKSRPHLKSLCSLDTISLGKTNISNNSTDNRKSEKTDRNVGNRLNLDQLLKGKSGSTNTNNTVKRETRTSQKQTSGMTTLDNLAGNKVSNSQKQEKKNQTMTTNNSYVKSSVINNLEAYVPKVTLESIGKKGSLF